MPGSIEASYQTKSPVLFVIFNRPDTTQLVFDQIRIAKPKKLYIAADGPRQKFEGEASLCKQTRAITDNVDWDCEVKRLSREENFGCRDGVSAAISWFFSQEEEGIILEDDCLPAKSFFRFCDTLLEKYRDDTRIRHITGCNLQLGKKWGDASYYFSNRTHVWGWASWRRVWADYDKTLAKYNADEVRTNMLNIYRDNMIAGYWTNIFEGVKAGRINSWAYQLDFANFFNHGLTLIPNENLISNIGFVSGATHTVDRDNVYANIPISEIGQITDPLFMVPEKRADLFTMLHDFNITSWNRNKYLLKNKLRPLLNLFK